MRITKENVMSLGSDNWKDYRKKVLTRAFRADFQAMVATQEGDIIAKPGDFIAVDQSGYPYPINQKEFDLLYELA